MTEAAEHWLQTLRGIAQKLSLQQSNFMRNIKIISLIQIVDVWHTWLLTLYDRKLITPVTPGGVGRERPTSNSRAQQELEPFPGVCWCLKDQESNSYFTSLPRKSEVAERIYIWWMEGVEWGCTCSLLPSPTDPEPSEHQGDSQTLDRNFSSGS